MGVGFVKKWGFIYTLGDASAEPRSDTIGSTECVLICRGVRSVDDAPGRAGGPIGKADLATNQPSALRPHFLGNPCGDRSGSQAPRLGAADHFFPGKTRIKTHLRQLRCFTGPGRACNSRRQAEARSLDMERPF